jgi:uncharacterized membrane protein (Fun14 family)
MRRLGSCATRGARTTHCTSSTAIHDVKLGNQYIKLAPAGRRKAATGVVAGALGLRLLCGSNDGGAAQCMPEGKSGEVGDDGVEAAKKKTTTTTTPDAVAAAAAGAAAAAARGGGGDADDDVVAKALAALTPYVSQLGMGGFFGFTSGYALKKIGKVAAFGTGCVFMLLQGLAYEGIIDIHWGELQRKAKAALDLDGDGNLDMKDAVLLWKKYVKPMLTYHLPGAVGFPVGFLAGFRNG